MLNKKKYSILRKVYTIKQILFYIPYFCLSLFLFFAAIGQYYWFFELFSNFYIQYFVTSFLFLIIAFVKKEKIFIILSILLLSICSVYIFPEIHTNKHISYSNNENYTFLSLNLQYNARNPEKVIQYIHTNKPDVIGFLEYTPYWKKELSPLLKTYSYHIEHPLKGGFGIGLYSKYPLRNQIVQSFGKTSIMSIYSEIEIHNKSIPLIVSHPPPPSGKNRAAIRNSQLISIADFIKKKKTAIFMGDFNLTPWSYYFQKILHTAQLKDSRNGFGLQTSWPSFMPLLSIPIDHFLYKGDIKILQRSIGSSVGSDHFPVLVKIKLL